MMIQFELLLVQSVVVSILLLGKVIVNVAADDPVHFVTGRLQDDSDDKNNRISSSIRHHREIEYHHQHHHRYLRETAAIITSSTTTSTTISTSTPTSRNNKEKDVRGGLQQRGLQGIAGVVLIRSSLCPLKMDSSEMGGNCIDNTRAGKTSTRTKRTIRNRHQVINGDGQSPVVHCGYDYVWMGGCSSSTSSTTTDDEEDEEEVDNELHCLPRLNCGCDLFGAGTWVCQTTADLLGVNCSDGMKAPTDRGQSCPASSQEQERQETSIRLSGDENNNKNTVDTDSLLSIDNEEDLKETREETEASVTGNKNNNNSNNTTTTFTATDETISSVPPTVDTADDDDYYADFTNDFYIQDDDDGNDLTFNFINDDDEDINTTTNDTDTANTDNDTIVSFGDDEDKNNDGDKNVIIGDIDDDDDDDSDNDDDDDNDNDDDDDDDNDINDNDNDNDNNNNNNNDNNNESSSTSIQIVPGEEPESEDDYTVEVITRKGDDSDEESCHTIADLLCGDSVEDFTKVCDLFQKAFPTDHNNKEDITITALLDTKDGSSPMTLFAPTDQAFDNLSALFSQGEAHPQQTDGAYTMLEIFHFHLTAGTVLQQDLRCGALLEMSFESGFSRTHCDTSENRQNQRKIVKSQKGGGNRKNNLEPIIVAADIRACHDSIIHIISEVMLPNFIDEL